MILATLITVRHLHHTTLQALLRHFLNLRPAPRFAIEFLGAAANGYFCNYEVMHTLCGLFGNGSPDLLPARKALDIFSQQLQECGEKDSVLANLRVFSANAFTDHALSLEMFDR